MSWSTILAQRGIMNGEQPDENKRHQAWSSVELFEWWPPSLPACMSFLGQSFAHLTSPDGVLYGAN
jgi:hypothetical protein